MDCPPVDKMTTPSNSSSSKMEDMKKAFLGDLPRVFVNGDFPDLRRLGVYLLTNVIPKMDEGGDVAFAWLWARKDVGVYNQKEYDTETATYQTKWKMEKTDGDTTWVYEFKKGDKKRRCIVTTEIWFTKKGDHSLSPIAVLFRQMFGNGLHIAKCRFEDAE